LKPSGKKERHEVALSRLIEAKVLSRATAVTISVLVWGPAVQNPSADQAKYAEKRQQIKDLLSAEGHRAYFSEDLVTPGSPHPVNLSEVSQAEHMDAIIVIGSSFGAIGEIHEFALELGPKFLIWLPAGAQESFTDVGARRMIEAAGGRVVFFKADALLACALALASVDFINEKRYLRARIDQQIERLKKLR
jgi:hypothetical protein